VDVSRVRSSVGASAPLGATPAPEGVNFSVYSKHAGAVELLLFDRDDDQKPVRVISLDSHNHRTGFYWHTFVSGLSAGQLYGYRVRGPARATGAMRFVPDKVLLDPYARGVVVPHAYGREAARGAGDNSATAMKSIVVDIDAYDWEGDLPLRRPAAQTIVYELHVRGFTRHASSGVSESKRGTYAGLIEKIPYLQELGITAVELLPVFQFDAQDCPAGLVNYWGYAPVSFFAPHAAYSSRQGPSGPVDEFRDMVKALHRAGIEVILDVVYNHTAEGPEGGPTLCFRGFENDTYYIMEEGGRRYANYSGCGNTLNANHPVVRRLILDSLHYWVDKMHVDGFRFDLASVLSRDQNGHPMANPPVIWDIDSDPVLAGTKLIAEAWDAAGLYQVGSFVGDRWWEWNGRFRDDARAFFRAEPWSAADFADRMVGSPQMYAHEGREAEQSVNFVTCHDGFSLNDLVSYNDKHNEANLENNRDGANDNRSWNCGVEGPTNDSAIERLRNRQVKNFFAVTLLAIGTPMILMGDEMRRTQLGNNNAYCFDNESNWLDWSSLRERADVHRFVALLNRRRQRRDIAHERERISLAQLIAEAEKEWHGVKLYQPDWSRDSHTIAFGVRLKREETLAHIILNSYWLPLEFELPVIDAATGMRWCRWIDTALDSPADIVPWESAVPYSASRYRADARSVVVLFARGTSSQE